ncbi:MAG: ABC transporter substrate-binding protein [Candidatus Thorarchaeota archaeon]|nr:ABC transporter substrate-binding protein [Candidatus Thorarchaeota archaeon]
MERNQLIAIVVIIVVVAGAGVAFLLMTGPSRPLEDTFVFETIGNPQFMDPHADYENYGGFVFYNVYETLYSPPFGSESTQTADLRPNLAASAPVIADSGKNYTIALRQNVVFHDGTPFNASVVQWNIYRAAKMFYLDGPFWMIAECVVGGQAVEDAAFSGNATLFQETFDAWVESGEGIEVIDEFTVRFVLTDSFGYFMPILTYTASAMMSPTFVLAHADEGFTTWDTFGVDYLQDPISDPNYMVTHTCGTGPYMLTEWIPDSYIHLELNTDYWRTFSAPTYAGSIKHIYLRTNEDVTGRILNLRAGTSDAVLVPRTNAQDVYNNVTAASLYPETIYLSKAGYGYGLTFMGFNLAQVNTTAGTFYNSPFQNLAIRKCVSYAFDYNAFLAAAVQGFGFRADSGPIPLGLLGYNTTAFTDIQYNITRAVEMWNEAVLDPTFLANMAGTLTSTGTAAPNTIQLFYNSGNTEREQGCLLIKDGLEDVLAHDDANMTAFPDGVTVTVQALEWSNYLAYTRYRQVMLFFVGWGPDYPDPDNFIFPFGYSRGTNGYRIRYNNTNVDAWYMQAKTANVTERTKLYSWILQAMADDYPYLWTYQQGELRVWRTWVHGDGLKWNPLSGVYSFYFYHMYKDYAGYDAGEAYSPYV